MRQNCVIRGPVACYYHLKQKIEVCRNPIYFIASTQHYTKQTNYSHGAISSTEMSREYLNMQCNWILELCWIRDYRAGIYEIRG